MAERLKGNKILHPSILINHFVKIQKNISVERAQKSDAKFDNIPYPPPTTHYLVQQALIVLFINFKKKKTSKNLIDYSVN